MPNALSSNLPSCLRGSPHQSGHDDHQLSKVEWLCDVRLTTGEDSLLPIFGTRKRGERRSSDSPPLRFAGPDTPHQFVPIHAGHPDITQEHIRLARLQQYQCLVG
jgi:hypothetical protein